MYVYIWNEAILSGLKRHKGASLCAGISQQRCVSGLHKYEHTSAGLRRVDGMAEREGG